MKKNCYAWKVVETPAYRGSGKYVDAHKKSWSNKD